MLVRGYPQVAPLILYDMSWRAAVKAIGIQHYLLRDVNAVPPVEDVNHRIVFRTYIYTARFIGKFSNDIYFRQTFRIGYRYHALDRQHLTAVYVIYHQTDPRLIEP